MVMQIGVRRVLGGEGTRADLMASWNSTVFRDSSYFVGYLAKMAFVSNGCRTFPSTSSASSASTCSRRTGPMGAAGGGGGEGSQTVPGAPPRL